MNLTKINYFVEAAKCLNFTEAANRLFTTQPNLSRQISMMEDELGAALFYRTGKAVALTPAGKYLFEQIRDIPDITTKAFEHVRAFGRGEVGQIFIGLLEGLDVSSTLIDKIFSLQKEYKNLDFDIERNNFSLLRKGLMEYKYDIIITLSFELQTLSDIDYITLLSQRGALGISKDNPKAFLKNPTLLDFKDEDFIAISPEVSPGGYELLIEQCQNNGFTPNIVRQVHSSESLMLGIEAGLGVSIIDTTSRLLKSDSAKLIPLPDSEYSNLVAIWRKDNHNPLISQISADLHRTANVR